MVKRGSADLKKLAALQLNLVRASRSLYNVPQPKFCHQPRQKNALQKTSHDLQLSLVSFQRAQQVSAERQRTVVEGVKIAVEEEHGEYVTRRPIFPPWLVLSLTVLDTDQGTTGLWNNARLKSSRRSCLPPNSLIKKLSSKNVKLKFERSKLAYTNCMKSLGIWVPLYRSKGICSVRSSPTALSSRLIKFRHGRQHREQRLLDCRRHLRRSTGTHHSS